MISIHQKPPSFAEDEVCLQVMAAGLCRSDLAIIAGEWGTGKYIPGHEFSGRVLLSGAQAKADFPELKQDQAVCVNPLIGCGQCNWCQAEQPEHCEHSQMLGLHRDGCFSAYVTVPARACVIPEMAPVTRTQWAMLAYAEPVAAALGVLRAIPEQGLQNIAIVGHNRIARLTRMILAQHHLEATCVDFKHLNASVHQRAYDIIIEAGLPFHKDDQAMARVLSALKTGGRCLLKSRHVNTVSVNLSALVRRDLRLQGLYYGNFAQAVQLLTQLDLNPLMGEFYEADQYDAFLDSSKTGESYKAFLFPGWV